MSSDRTVQNGYGQLQLNALEPVIAHNVLGSLLLLVNAVDMLRERCVAGITSMPKNCSRHLESSTALVTSLVTLLGYDQAASIAKEALETGRRVREIALQISQIPHEETERLLDPNRKLLQFARCAMSKHSEKATIGRNLNVGGCAEKNTAASSHPKGNSKGGNIPKQIEPWAIAMDALNNDHPLIVILKTD